MLNFTKKSLFFGFFEVSEALFGFSPAATTLEATGKTEIGGPRDAPDPKMTIFTFSKGFTLRKWPKSSIFRDFWVLMPKNPCFRP